MPGGFRARYEGICAVCLGSIRPGESIRAAAGWDEHADALLRDELGSTRHLLRPLRWQHVGCSSPVRSARRGAISARLRRLGDLRSRISRRPTPQG